MSKIEMLRLLINQRLTAAAEEIFGVFGRTIAEYEEQISRYKLEIQRQRRLQELRMQPQISLQLHSAARPEQQDWSCESTPPHIKEEEEELWPVPQEEEPQEEAPQEEAPPASENNHVNFMLFQSGGVRNEPDLNHMTSPLPKFTSQDPEDPEDLEEPQLDPQLGTSVQQTCTDLVQDSPEASDNGQLDCVELEAPLSEVVDSYICTICGRAFAQRGHWAKHVQVHRKVGSKTDKSYTCEICGKRLTRFDGYQKHLRIHTGEKPYSCEECGRRFSDNSNYKRHIRTHTTPKTQQS
ncbi:B-cell lymphoma 6 protein homolog [Thunnus maccoyii]|uniref:B-cell lymphoma 6 protein homolog n=1 Tax=Thunnus maccoyii TaxID=8240 RepID=UPI001C4C7A20|nr:B-cell lymphoma 6 protein homolog [Thunnus maccoyii]